MNVRPFLVCVAAAPLLVAATHPISLEPSSPWNMDYAQNSCRLIRTFGVGGDRTTLILESPAPGLMTMLVTGKPLKTGVREVPGRFIPSDVEPMKGRLAESSDGTPAILWAGVRLASDVVNKRLEEEAAQARKRPDVRPPAMDLSQRAAELASRQAFAAAVSGIEIDTQSDRSVVLQTGSLSEPIRIFDLCIRDALRDWGVDPDVQDKIVRPVWAPQPERWLVGADYPPDMIRRNRESEVSARLLVDATGKPTSCTNLSYFKEPEFNRTVCAKFMARAHFQPAELADGTKVPSYYTVHVIFRVGP